LGYLKKIDFFDFRNFEEYSCDFSKNCNVFFGRNGSGKTNILEGISLLGKGKGLRKDKLKNLIKKEKDKFLISGSYEKNNISNNIKVYSEFSNNNYKKITSLNNDLSKESVKYVNNLFNFLYFLPEMERLFLSSPNKRRNFIDQLIYASNIKYADLVNKYKKSISERFNLLNSNRIDENWLLKLEDNISSFGTEIYFNREKQIKILDENLKKIKRQEYPYEVSIKIIDTLYHPKLTQTDFLQSLKNSREYDKLVGGIKNGPHKSDFFCTVNNDYSASQLSTGQQKTVVLLIILAQCNFLVNECNLSPILLFDEICSHLDENNRRILQHITNDFDLQIFMTGTDKNLFSFMSTNTNFYNITK